ncbi:MAG: biopolymer transporter ExbD [bacterium]|nr:biopolymer transporter ExbD [bacterium]
MFNRKKRRIEAQLNVTPLVDVVLQLVLFFMVTTTFVLQTGFKITLPRTSVREIQPIRDLVVSISQNGAIFLNSDRVTLDNFSDKLKKIGNLQEKLLIIKADKKVYHEVVVNVMDIAKTNGVNKIVIATEHKVKNE